MKKNIDTKIINSILPVLFAFFLGGIIISIMGENPFDTYKIMIEKSVFDIKGITRTLQICAPLIISAISISICFKANIYNMGIEGQLIFGGFMAGIAGNMFYDMNPTIHKLICFLVGIFCGMLFALVPAILRAYFNVDEMVVTLVLNYAMSKTLEYLASVVFRDDGAGYVATAPIKDSAKFFLIGSSKMTAFVFLAFLIFIFMAFIIKHTKLGYSIEALGKNPLFAEATGIRSRRLVIILMLLSGALAGIAGAGYMLSEKTFYTLNFSGNPGLGWDGMLIALLGRHTPAGILAASLFYSALKTGSEKIGLYTNVPNEIIAVIQGLIVLFLAVQFFNERYSILEKIKKYLAKSEV